MSVLNNFVSALLILGIDEVEMSMHIELINQLNDISESRFHHVPNMVYS